MGSLKEWFANPFPWQRGIRAGAFAAVVLGAILIVGGLIMGNTVFGSLFLGFMFGGPLVIAGVWAIRRPSKKPRVVGAFVGALSAPLYLPLLFMMHPNDAGVDLGRGAVAFFLLVAVPVNMRICAALAQRICQPWWTENGLAGNPRVTLPSSYWLARSVGFVVAAVGLLILWQANHEASPDPEIALWELVHHGILPAVPIIVLGVCTALLPSRLSIMCGALVGLFPALACSSLLIDPDPDNHGQTVSALVAYSLPLTLPFTVGLGGLLGNYLHRQLARGTLPSNSA